MDKPYTIQFTDEDIVENKALAFKLETDFHILIREFHYEDEPQWKDVENFFGDFNENFRSWLSIKLTDYQEAYLSY